VERINETTVSFDYHSSRLDKYLSKRFTYLSRTEWQREILSGRVYINSEKITVVHKRLHYGDMVSYTGRGISEPEVDTNYSILYEDDSLLGINKSGNLPVHPSGRYFMNTLQRLLEGRLKIKLYPVHRLDRETSGVVIMAKNPDVASRIQKSFRSVMKKYIAIVHGNVSRREFMIDVPIGRDLSSSIRKKRSAYYGAKETARTYCKRLFCFDEYSLISAIPETGRLHQIRVHLHYAGYPIVGDKLYGCDETLFLKFIENGLTDEVWEQLLMRRSALHSRSISLIHPDTGKSIMIKAALPDDFREFIERRV
jgi:RluA family pseudouridine synthase